MSDCIQDLRHEAEFRHGDVVVTLRQGVLALGNAHFRRLQELTEKGICTTLVEDGAGRPRAVSDGGCDYEYYGLGRKPTVTAVQARVVPEGLFDGEHVEVAVTLTQASQGVEIIREYLIYPGLPALSVRHRLRTTISPRLGWTARSDLNQYMVKPLEARVDRLIPLGSASAIRCVIFQGRTDHCDTPVVEVRPDSLRELRGNLLFYEESDGSGLAFLQEAPPSAERRDLEAYDFRLDDWGVVCSCNWGIHPSELEEGRNYLGYRSTLLLYATAAERDRIIKAYQRRRYPHRFAQAGGVTVNPWGGGGFVKKVSTNFLLAEIAASADLGGTAYQMDDGWQQGDTRLAHVDNFVIDPAFWQISDRLEGSFNRLQAQAERHGLELALWFLPSSNRNYRDWPESLEIILDMYRRYGIRKVKIDGLYIRNYEAQENLEKLLKAARTASNGEIFFNLDVTSSQRGGYLQFLEYGNLFLENRYGWSGIGYHPEKILRHLWMLAKYIRPQTIQAEIASPVNVDPEFYRKRGMSDPRTYPLEYWSAVAFCASPLLWLNPSELPPEQRPPLRRGIDLHRQFAELLFEAEIYPCGDCPDGSRITGFQVVPGRLGDPHLLIFYREQAAGKETLRLKLPQPLPASPAWELVAGNASLAPQPHGSWEVTLPQPASFALFRALP